MNIIIFFNSLSKQFHISLSQLQFTQKQTCFVDIHGNIIECIHYPVTSKYFTYKTIYRKFKIMVESI